MTEQQLEAIAAAVLEQIPRERPCGTVPLEASARHVHLTQAAAEQLFGPGAQLKPQRALSQPGEFLAEQRVKLVTPKGTLEHVAVLGPVRGAVQAELSLTDCRALGIQAPVKLSGNLAGAAALLIVGPAGHLYAKDCAIAAQNHIHMTPQDAAAFGVADGQTVCVRAQTARPVAFECVTVRVSERFALACHLDFDEANACALAPGNVGEVFVRGAAGGAQSPAAQPHRAKLITEAMAKQMTGPVRLQKGAIITPAARDVFAQKKILVEWV
jgi:propanediol utilization protein